MNSALFASILLSLTLTVGCQSYPQGRPADAQLADYERTRRSCQVCLGMFAPECQEPYLSASMSMGVVEFCSGPK